MTTPGADYDRDDEIVRERLRTLYLSRLGAGGHCTLDQIGGAGSGHGVEDPTARMDHIANLSMILRECTLEERCALELDIVREDLPLDDDPPTAAPGVYRVPPSAGQTTKCALMTEALGQPWTAERFDATVKQALGKVRAAIRRAAATR